MEYEKNNEEITNYARIAGTVVSEPQKSHEIEGESFFEFKVEVQRLSQNKDILPVTISERLLNEEVKVGHFVDVVGEYRSYNKMVGERSRLILNFFAKECKLVTENSKYINEIKLTGFVCKQPIYRKTPFEREICDVLLAVNRLNYHKSDYIPCILWGRNARFLANQNIGCKVELTGRIQSREYSKTLSDGKTINNTAYEVSCQTIAILGNVAKLSKNQEVENAKVANN